MISQRERRAGDEARRKQKGKIERPKSALVTEICEKSSFWYKFNENLDDAKLSSFI